jgi:hypothetical protein
LISSRSGQHYLRLTGDSKRTAKHAKPWQLAVQRINSTWRFRPIVAIALCSALEQFRGIAAVRRPLFWSRGVEFLAPRRRKICAAHERSFGVKPTQ